MPYIDYILTKFEPPKKVITTSSEDKSKVYNRITTEMFERLEEELIVKGNNSKMQRKALAKSLGLNTQKVYKWYWEN